MDIDCLNDCDNDFNKNIVNALKGINEIFKDPLTQVFFLILSKKFIFEKFKIIFKSLNHVNS